MNDSARKLLHWSPRVLIILFAAFVSLFAFDVWEMAGGFWARLGGFLVHLLPVYFIAAAGLVGWKRPLWGGVLCFVVALGMLLRFDLWEPSSFLMLVAPLVVCGILFVWDAWATRPVISPRF